jgi:hypothetical protein
MSITCPGPGTTTKNTASKQHVRTLNALTAMVAPSLVSDYYKVGVVCTHLLDIHCTVHHSEDRQSTHTHEHEIQHGRCEASIGIGAKGKAWSSSQAANT